MPLSRPADMDLAAIRLSSPGPVVDGVALRDGPDASKAHISPWVVGLHVFMYSSALGAARSVARATANFLARFVQS